MYYRRKILLAFLNLFEGGLNKLALHKLLFIISNSQKRPSYHFVPYKYGCYSFQANKDLSTLQKYGLVSLEGYKWKSTTIKNFYNELTHDDRELLTIITKRYKGKSNNYLLNLTYSEYPYYSINSTIIEEVLDINSKDFKNQHKPRNTKSKLYTIGYEGISLEEYLNKLIKFDIKILCDVRKNPLSMKFGFSKKQLQKACESIGIKYLHFPNAGIPSEFRKDLGTDLSYKKLFEKYNNEILPNCDDVKIVIIDLIENYKRVAITCFEADKNKCHRFHLANSILKLGKGGFDICHI